MNATLADFRLPKRVRGTLLALVPVVCPADAVPLGLADPIVDHVELMMRAFSGTVRRGLVAGLLAFDAGALGFSRLDDEAKRAYFHRWWKSPLLPMRQFVKAVKGLLALSYYEEPTVKARMEYHPDRWIAQAAEERLRRFAAEIQAHEVQVTAPDPLVSLPADPGRKRHAG
jgi:hypothetical protein